MATSKLIEQLQNPELYDHPVTGFTLIETHISWVILTGEFVYKIKKPLDLEFLNFSSLEKRQHFCQEEVRLNKILAPEIYLDVLPITGSEDNPQINGEGEVIEYAIKMREFPQDQLFDKLLERHELSISMVDELAKGLADFHAKAKVCGDDMPYGTVEQVHEPVIQNFDQVLPFLDTPAATKQLQRVRTWAEQEHQRIKNLLAERKEKGLIRECHGDVHLGNIVSLHGKPVIFDCIEFNESFRWTDTMADLGFLAMDLQYNKKFQFAHRLINRYMLETGDYAGLGVLRYYKSYRAMVRAKVALFHREQQNTAAEKSELTEKYNQCMELAERYTNPTPPTLIITHGFSASGKTSISKALCDQMGYIHIDSDAERKRLCQMDLDQSSDSGVNEGIYTEEMTAKTYQRLANLAEKVIRAGYSVVVDASFLKSYQRLAFAKLAEELNVKHVILHTHARLNVLKNWLRQRQLTNESISEANEAVLEMQQASQEALSDEEKAQAISIDLEKYSNINEILPILKDMLNRDTQTVEEVT